MSETVYFLLDSFYSNFLFTEQAASDFLTYTVKRLPDLCLVGMFVIASSFHVMGEAEKFKARNDERLRKKSL